MRCKVVHWRFCANLRTCNPWQRLVFVINCFCYVFVCDPSTKLLVTMFLFCVVYDCHVLISRGDLMRWRFLSPKLNEFSNIIKENCFALSFLHQLFFSLRSWEIFILIFAQNDWSHTFKVIAHCERGWHARCLSNCNQSDICLIRLCHKHFYAVISQFAGLWARHYCHVIL